MLHDDFVSMLQAAALEPVSIVHQYRLQKDLDSNGIFAFFEGDEDKLFYVSHIRNRANGRKIYTHICDGKDGVLSVSDELADEDSTLLFFVDRDYDDFFNNKNIVKKNVFVTEWYSAESYLASKDMVEVLWDEFIPLPKDKRFDHFLEDFDAKRSEFVRSILPVTAWILSQIGSGEKVFISNIKIKSLINLNEVGRFCRKKNAMAELVRCHHSKVDAKPAYNKLYWSRALWNIDPLIWVRGKFILWFVEEYLSMRWASIQAIIPKGKRKADIPAGIQNNKLFETFGSRLPCSKKLDKYMRSNIL